MEPIKNILNKNIRDFGLEKKIEQGNIVESMKELLRNDFGEQGIEPLQSVSFRNGTINIKSRSASLRQEIKFRENKYMIELNRQYGAGTIKKFTYFS